VWNNDVLGDIDAVLDAIVAAVTYPFPARASGPSPLEGEKQESGPSPLRGEG
jgi:hypothetical protein